jgi:hypothetical protein
MDATAIGVVGVVACPSVKYELVANNGETIYAREDTSAAWWVGVGWTDD